MKPTQTYANQVALGCGSSSIMIFKTRVAGCWVIEEILQMYMRLVRLGYTIYLGFQEFHEMNCFEGKKGGCQLFLPFRVIGG